MICDRINIGITIKPSVGYDSSSISVPNTNGFVDGLLTTVGASRRNRRARLA